MNTPKNIENANNIQRIQTPQLASVVDHILPKCIDSNSGAVASSLLELTPIVDEQGLRSMPAINRIARYHGRFLTGLIDTLVSDISQDEKDTTVQKLLGGLPTALRRVYQKVHEKLQDKIRINHELLEKHAGNEPEFMLRARAKAVGIGEDQMQSLLSENLGKIEFKEPYYGMPVLFVDSELYNGKLKELKIVLPTSQGVTISA
ncbi:MAG: hypothetical protein V1744_02050, partial [Candidatus Altiarchaeota archaeon]